MNAIADAPTVKAPAAATPGTGAAQTGLAQTDVVGGDAAASPLPAFPAARPPEVWPDRSPAPLPAPPLLLALEAAQAGCSAVLAEGPRILAELNREGPSGEAAFLPGMVAELLASAGLAPGAVGAVAVSVGPGSFTGLRASIAFASGFAGGAALPLIGVTAAEALASALGEMPGPDLWCALDARQGRIFLHQGGAPDAWQVATLDDPPQPRGPIRLTGDGAAAFAAALAARGAAARETGAVKADARGVAAAALARLRGDLAPLALRPLYIDPPRALLPRGGLRPPPAAPEAA
ncbi:tRNA (adenosine(37)-N6)-threonylcarbamoyltransferase complex dimerization subunit type 1 TsaB [Acidisoma sp. C75]